MTTCSKVSCSVKEAKYAIESFRNREKKYYHKSITDLGHCNKSSNFIEMKEDWRVRMCEWAYSIADHYARERFVVNIAFNYVDRYIYIIGKEKNGNVKVGKHEFQLITMTSLYIALKLNRQNNLKSSSLMDDFVRLSRGIFIREDIQTMEQSILHTLKWHVNPPTSEYFIFYLLHCIPIFQNGQENPSPQLIDDPVQYDHQSQIELTTELLNAIYELACICSEWAVSCFEISMHQSPSVIGIASILAAMDISQSWTPTNLKEIAMDTAKDVMRLESDEVEDVFNVCCIMKQVLLQLQQSSNSRVRNTHGVYRPKHKKNSPRSP